MHELPDELPSAVKELIEKTPKFNSLKIPIDGTRLKSPEEYTDPIPENMESVDRAFEITRRNHPKKFQHYHLIKNITERIVYGSLLTDDERPEKYIEKAEELDEENQNKSRLLRLAIAEYVAQDVNTNIKIENDPRIITLLRAIFGEDKDKHEYSRQVASELLDKAIEARNKL